MTHRTTASSAILLSALLGCFNDAGGGGATDTKSAGAKAKASHLVGTRGVGNREGERMAKATFAAGCFWGVEETFRNIEGVTGTTVGYTGGRTANPTYEEVCTDRTDHAEAVEVEYDPSKVSYEKLLDVFWSSHDPTTRNRQGPDVGTQYRSAIFYHTPGQKTAAEASKAALEASGRFKRPIVTEIVPATTFYRAEEYHQKYLVKHGRAACPTHKP